MSPDEGPVGTHGFLGLFCGLCQADIDCNLTIGHDTEQPDSKHHMILIPSSSARLEHTQQETHNEHAAFCLGEVLGEIHALAK